MLVPMSAYAGGINGNESRVIGAASGTFTYNGGTYKASSGSLGQLRAYLAGDDVDLTAAQASSAISQMYGSIAQGVAEGVLVYIGEGQDPNRPGGNSVNNEEVSDMEYKGKDWGSEEARPKNPGKITMKDGVLVIFNSDKKIAASIEGPIKNTGYSLNNMVLAVAALLAAAGIVAGYSYRKKNMTSRRKHE